MIAEVPHRLGGERADKVVAVLAGLSRTEARRLVEQGAVRRGGVVLAPAERVAAGSVIEFEPMQAEPVPIQRVSYRVILEEPEFLVIAKPAGVTVHPGAGRPGGTLADTLAADWPELVGVGEPGRWGIVHRLDKDTSGLLLIARTAQSHRDLATALAARRIHRSYLALVEGCVDPPRGTVDAPIGREPGGPTRRAVGSDGKPAPTHYPPPADWRAGIDRAVRYSKLTWKQDGPTRSGSTWPESAIRWQETAPTALGLMLPASGSTLGGWPSRIQRPARRWR